MPFNFSKPLKNRKNNGQVLFNCNADALDLLRHVGLQHHLILLQDSLSVLLNCKKNDSREELVKAFYKRRFDINKGFFISYCLLNVFIIWIISCSIIGYKEVTLMKFASLQSQRPFKLSVIRSAVLPQVISFIVASPAILQMT